MDTKKFEFFCSRVAAGVGILILGFLSLYSIFYTRKFPTNHDEMPVQTWGSPVSLVILVVLLIAAVGYLGHWILKNEKHRERNIRLLLAFTCIYAAVYGIVWAFACKYHMMWDPQLVSFWGDQLAHGMNDVSASDIDYLSSYPHQMGLIALLELVYRICGPENYHAFQVLNGLGAGAIVYLGCKIIRMTTKRQEPAVYFLLLMLCCHPLYIYVCFVYGEVLSVCLSFLAVYALLLYLERRQIRYGVLLGAALTLACLVRSNCYIVIAAIACVLLVKMISDKKLRHGLVLLLCLAMFFVSHTALDKFYEQRLGFSLENGMPTVLWVAMGLQEGGSDGIEREAGWYNGFAYDVFVDECGRDQEQSKQIGMEAVMESLTNFKEHPAYAADFFWRKIGSQWVEPTYSCLQETNRRIEERSTFMDRLYKGDLWPGFVRFMDVYQSVIYFGAFLFLLLIIRKKIPVEQLSLLIVVIGGFLFYVVWEAKSRYVLPYFIMLIPSAACGWDLFLQKLGRLWEKCGVGRRVRAFAAKLQTEKTEQLCSRVILLLAGLPTAFLFLYSLIFTTIYESNDLEVPSQTVDPVPLILLFVAASLAALWMAGRWILKKEANRKRNLHILLGVVLVHCAVFCIAWNLLAQSALRADPLYIHAIGGGFALSDLNESAMDYLYTYPHQAGQALLVEIVYRIFGYENFFAFRMVNTLGVLVFVVSGFAITGELFRKDRAQVNFLLLAAGCVPLFVYTNVIYGEVLAIAAVSFGLWMFLRWLREEKLRDLILMILALVFAVYMKNNALIAAVAIILTALIKAVAEHRKKLAVWMIPFLAALLLSQPAMTKLYEHRSGWPLDRGMPKTLWVAMGLQGEGMTAGWWNEYPDKVYKEQAGYNPEEADAIAKEAIAFSVKGFAEHPKAAVSFFGHKFVSQWNDAGYGCEVSAGSQDTPRLEFWMNGYQSLIFLGACAFAVLAWKRRYRIEACLPVLILLGGYLFHLAWEVKGRYGLFYFVLLLPAAAEGLAGLTEKALKKEKAGENVHEA